MDSVNKEAGTASSGAAPLTEPAAVGPPPAAPDDASEPVQDDDSKPWALRLGKCSDLLSSCLACGHLNKSRIAGEYLQRRATGEPDESAESQPWALRLGTYLSEKKPGPWSLIANDKPQDPLVSAHSTFPCPFTHHEPVSHGACVRWHWWMPLQLLSGASILTVTRRPCGWATTCPRPSR
jgi:hypothetical protein